MIKLNRFARSTDLNINNFFFYSVTSKEKLYQGFQTKADDINEIIRQQGESFPIFIEIVFLQKKKATCPIFLPTQFFFFFFNLNNVKYRRRWIEKCFKKNYK